MATIKRHINADGEATDFLLIKNVRTSFLRVFQPEFNDLKEKDEFSVDLLIPKDTDMSEFNALIADLKLRKWKNADHAVKQAVLKDGDNKKSKAGDPYEDYKGMVYITPWNTDRPDVIDGLKAEITEASEFQSGDFCNCFIQCYAYDKKGNTGIAYSLETIQKSSEGARMSGGMSKTSRRDVFSTEVMDI